ncbi:hypothetical protein KGY79_11725, partial [Candidatus Bipolaricaulota bacterium]|nr:hypothetical protein [Candidatus Bipolaricaulota bacterium]
GERSLKGKYVWSFSPLAIDKMAENEEIIQMLAKQMTFDLYLDLTSMLSNPPKVKKMGMGPSLVDIISKINEMFKTKPYLEEQFSRLLQQVIEEDSNRIMMEGNAQPLKDAKDFNEFAKILLTLLDAGQQISSSSH